MSSLRSRNQLCDWKGKGMPGRGTGTGKDKKARRAGAE